jgi:hypothetical protein
MEIEVLVTAEREILHEIKKWMPDLIITSPKALALKAKTIADSILSRQIEELIG